MLEATLANIRIVLVEPAGALNVGSIARVMKNMGLCQLVLVNPHCDYLGDEARQMAVHAQDVLEAAKVVRTLPEGLTQCQGAIATTARTRTLPAPLEHPRVALPWLVDIARQSEAALIFGPEDRGLNNAELNYAQRFLSIPSNPAYPSLNLAQATAICCYELYQLVESKDPSLPEGSDFTPATPATFEALEAYYQQLETLLLKVGYLYPHTADSRMKKFRRLFSRALPSTTEVAMLRGILSQVEWALQHSSKFLGED
ncbi:RNA methyltransferase [Leptothermofonsia sp. ETS-13]|uniref:RNA methyltransferase n=1 Tax=Leptothermofonsia sp. ETS-13 TaxID=3035696 RepID=UPI003B9E9094